MQKSDVDDDDSKGYEALEGAEDDDDEDDASDEKYKDEVKRASVEETHCGELAEEEEDRESGTFPISNLGGAIGIPMV